jgi:DNA-binding response OmpR family regulator
MQSRRILVVDDNHSIVKALELVLKHEGFQVFTAFDGMSALESVVKNKPHLLILDIVMPGMSGYDVCRRLSQHPETANIPVIMLTFKGRLDDDIDPGKPALLNRHLHERNQAYDAGATEFLTKPVIAKEVVMRVKQLLALS